MKSFKLPVIIVSFLLFAFAACSKSDDKAIAAPKKSSASKIAPKNSAVLPAEPSRTAGAFADPGMQKISDNPAFFTAQDLAPQAPEAQDLDRLLRPVFKALFEDAKLIEEIGKQPPQLDGEVEENKLIYATRRLLDESDGDSLHRTLHEEKGFSRTPRLGAKPTHSRTAVYMSLSKSTSRRGYSLVLVVDYGKQQISVISYQLGSKYDRMM